MPSLLKALVKSDLLIPVDDLNAAIERLFANIKAINVRIKNAKDSPALQQALIEIEGFNITRINLMLDRIYLEKIIN